MRVPCKVILGDTVSTFVVIERKSTIAFIIFLLPLSNCTHYTLVQGRDDSTLLSCSFILDSSASTSTSVPINCTIVAMDSGALSMSKISLFTFTFQCETVLFFLSSSAILSVKNSYFDEFELLSIALFTREASTLNIGAIETQFFKQRIHTAHCA